PIRGCGAHEGLTWGLRSQNGHFSAPFTSPIWPPVFTIRSSVTGDADTSAWHFRDVRADHVADPYQRGIKEVTRTVLSRRLLAGVAGVALATLTIAGCSTKTDNGTPAPTGTGVDLKSLAGSLKFTGATFPANFYNKALDEFGKVAPDLNITYQ